MNILLFVIGINAVTIVCVFFCIKGFTFVLEEFRVLRTNLERTGMILEGTSFFGHPDKDTPINKNFAYIFLYGYVIALVGGFVFTVGIMLFNLSVTLGIIIVTLQSR
jgi:hypothetical protein